MKTHEPLSELPANWLGLTSPFGWIGLARQQVTLKGLVGFHFLFYTLIFIYFLSMKPLSVEMACLLGIQNEIQAVCKSLLS